MIMQCIILLFLIQAGATLARESTPLIIELRVQEEFVIISRNRSNLQDGSCEKSVHKNFARFTRKHLRQSSFFNLIKLQASDLFLNFAKFLTAIFKLLTASIERFWLLMRYFHNICPRLIVY